MLIDLKNLKYYFLTCKNPVRKEHMLKEFIDYDITEVNPLYLSSKHQSTSSGFSKIFDLASRKQERNKPFQPFVVFEDDVKKYREFPDTIEIPDDTDILFIGNSIFGFYDNYTHHVCYKNINETIVKTFNMLSLHGFIICSSSGLLAFQKCMMESFFSNIISDIFTSSIQPYYNVYALRIPLVYQYGNIGGNEEPTKIEFNDLNHMDDNFYTNKTNISNITCFEEK